MPPGNAAQPDIIDNTRNDTIATMIFIKAPKKDWGAL